MDLPIDSICYHVYRDGEAWEVAFDHSQPLQRFHSRDGALEAARFAAEARWLLTNQPTCVGLGRPGLTFEIDSRYGPS